MELMEGLESLVAPVGSGPIRQKAYWRGNLEGLFFGAGLPAHSGAAALRERLPPTPHRVSSTP